ncbi:MAG: 30S ribosomal protein S7 [Chloroflexi bacterium]|nr:30S ribosomal protein S7 [Chloroflexota bacterium]
MARRRSVIIREIAPDPKYNSVYVAGFINKVMTRGKKSVAQRIVYDALDIVEKETSRDPLETFTQALRNATPQLEVKPRRVGGATYQVPVEVRSNRQQSLAMRWILRASLARTGRPMAERLALELQEASKGQGAAVRRREEIHRMAEANRAFVHYKW